MFQGFSQRSVDFLWELSLNNERPWFLEHKEEFLEVLDRPFRELAGDTAARMKKLWPQGDLVPQVSRIYRDARRLYGRGPYKDHLWFSLQQEDARNRGPMLWFELGLEGTSHGLGFWDRTAGQAELFRQQIDRDPERFRQLVRGIPQGERSRLWGDVYKRPKGHYDEIIDPWYNRRQLSVGYENLFGQEIFSPRLSELLAKSFAGLLPMYQFFQEVWQSSDEKPDQL